MRVGCFRQVEKIVRLENSKQRGTYYNILPLKREEKPLNILNTVDRFGRRYRSEQAEPKRSVSQFRLRYRKNFMLAIFLSVCDKPFIFVLARMANLSEREPNEKKNCNENEQNVYGSDVDWDERNQTGRTNQYSYVDAVAGTYIEC